MLFKHIPIQKKLMSISLLISAVVLLVACTAFFLYELYTFRQNTGQKLAVLGKVIAANSAAALAFDNKENADKILSALVAEPHIAAACLYDKDNKLFSKYPANLTDSSFPITAKQEEYRFDYSYLERFQPVSEGTSQLGTLYLKFDLRGMYARLRPYGIVTLLVIVVSFLLSYLLSKILQKTISVPIHSLAETAKTISGNYDYSVRAVKSGDDELGSLTDSFNVILRQIQDQNNSLKEFNKKLEQSERLFRAMIEKDADMKTLATRDGKVFYASPSVTTILGYENHEFMTIPALDLIHPGDVPGLMEGVTDIVQTPGKSFYRQQRLKHKNGNWIWCEGTITNMLHEPAVAALVSNFRNITERKQTEEALQENQQLLSAIVNNSTAVIYVKDLQGRYLLINHRFSELFHRSEEAILGKTDYDFFSREDADAFRKMDERTAAADHALTEEERVQQDDGLHAYISVKSTLRNTTGKPYAIFGISTDITDRKKAEESIRLAEANYREIFDKASDAIFVHEMETGKVIEVNQRASKITGYSKEELINGDPKNFIASHPQYTLQHAFNYLRKAAEGKPQLFEWLSKNKDGSYNWLEVNLKKASIAGQDRILAFFREINDRKKAQLEVQKLTEGLEQKVIDRTAELQAANRELESFSYSVSHDLRAPLRAIHGYTKILSEDYFNKMDDNAKQMMNSVLRNAGKMGRLIDDLLAFSKLGKKDLRISTVDMTKLATTALNDIRYSLPSMKAKIVILPLSPANGDPNLISQVFNNLISNAIKYSEGKDSPAIEIGSREEGREAIYYIKDNGAGFDMKYYDKLFGVFQRLHRDEEFEGTGVGLALVKRIITRHGGKVWAEAETGKGATFYFSLNKNE